MGKIFELRTGHYGLNYFFIQPSLNARERKWLEFLSEYDFTIKNIRGKENKVVDALNRRMHEIYPTTISMYQTYFHIKNLEVSKSDLDYMDISTTL
jgi:hypothetical protein